MRTNRPGMILLAVGLVLLLIGPAQAEDTFADDVKAECKDFKSHYKKMSDDEVTKAIDALLVRYKDEKCGEKSKKLIVAHIGYAARMRNDEIASHAIRALGETDENALKVIDSMLKVSLKAKPPRVDCYEACFDSLKKLASPKSVKTLTGYLKYKEADVVAQAASALEGYKDAKGSIRKVIFEELLKIGEGLYNAAKSDPQSSQGRRWRIIEANMMDAMNATSHQDLSDPQAARRWYNDNKKKNWDKL